MVPVVVSAAALWLLPLLASRSVTGSILLHWGSAALALAVAGAWHARFQSPSSFDWKPWIWLLILIAPGILLLIADEPRAPERMLRYGILLTLAWLVFMLMRTEGQRLWSSPAWGCALAGSALIHWCLSAYTMLHPESWLHYFVPGFSGPLMQNNWQALWYVIGLCWVSMYLNRQCASNIEKPAIVLLCTGSVLVAGIALSGSRSGFITLLIIAFLTIWMNKNAQKEALARWIIMGVAGLALMKLMELMASGHTTTFLRDAQIGSIGGRVLIWSIAWQTFLSHWQLGVGWGGLASHGMDAAEVILANHPEWAATANRIPGAHLYAHNWILQLLVESGLAGGAFAAALVTAMIRTMRSLRNEDMGRQAGWLVCAAILIQSMVAVSAAEPYFWFIFAMAAAATWPATGTKSRTASQALTGVWLAPALIVALLTWHELHQAYRLDETAHMPMKAPETIAIFSKAMNDPWLHATALHRLFSVLALTHASSRQWSAAEPYAWALWRTAQMPGYCMIFIAIAHAKNDVLSEQRWASRYVRLQPGHPPALRAFRHAWHKGKHQSLKLEKTW